MSFSLSVNINDFENLEKKSKLLKKAQIRGIHIAKVMAPQPKDVTAEIRQCPVDLLYGECCNVRVSQGTGRICIFSNVSSYYHAEWNILI